MCRRLTAYLSLAHRQGTGRPDEVSRLTLTAVRVGGACRPTILVFSTSDRRPGRIRRGGCLRQTFSRMIPI